MNEFTPARTETISAYKRYRAAHPEGNLLTFVENLRDTLATVRPNPDDAHFECDCVPDLGPSHCHACSKIAGTETPWSETYHGPLGERQVETVARGICEIGYIDGAFCMVHESYDEIADGYCTTGHWMAKNGLAALAEAVGRG